MSFLQRCKNVYFEITGPYKDLYQSVKLYWHSYGKLKSFILSPFLHIAFAISYFAWPLWNPVKDDAAVWYSLSLSVLPNLLGFTLGGYAILLAFGDSRFRDKISEQDEDDEEPTLFMELNGTFVHFIILQAIAILLAVIGTAGTIRTGFFAWFGFTCFLYTVLTAISAAFAVLEISDLFQTMKNRKHLE